MSPARLLLALALLIGGCFSSPPVADEEASTERLSGAYVTAVVDEPCPGESEDTASARRAIAHVRALAGLPMPRCDAAASRAALAHCAYIAANGGALTHVQIPGRNGFSGATFEDRLAAVGFADAPAGEVVASITGAESVTGSRGFLNSVYHRAFFLRSETLSFGYGAAAGCSTLDFGRARTAASGRDQAVLWPPNGARNVPYEFYAHREAPNPVPGSTVVGAPVSLIRRTALGKVEASISGPSGVIRTALLTHAGDPAHLVRPGEAHVIPLSPLAPNTTYRARFTVSGAVFETSFTTAREDHPAG